MNKSKLLDGLSNITTNWVESDIKEKLADIEHQRWSDWQKWCHKVLRENCPSPELEKVLERWDKQIETPYSKLIEKEKDSDREQVNRYWNLINLWHLEKLRKLLERVEKELFDIPYLCPFCVTRQNEETGECDCNCHNNEHIEEYNKQLKERFNSKITNLKGEL